MIFTGYYVSPLGNLMLAADEIGIRGLWFDGQKYFACDLPAERIEQNTPVLAEARRWLDIYFSGRQPDFTPAYRTDNLTPFRRQVQKIMLEIPWGQTVTYGGIASRIAAASGLSKMSAQAVGGAVGWNSLCLIIPCHRVMGAGGKVTGYGGGIKNKIELLKLEKIL